MCLLLIGYWVSRVSGITYRFVLDRIFLFSFLLLSCCLKISIWVQLCQNWKAAPKLGIAADISEKTQFLESPFTRILQVILLFDNTGRNECNVRNTPVDPRCTIRDVRPAMYDPRCSSRSGNVFVVNWFLCFQGLRNKL